MMRRRQSVRELRSLVEKYRSGLMHAMFCPRFHRGEYIKCETKPRWRPELTRCQEVRGLLDAMEVERG